MDTARLLLEQLLKKYEASKAFTQVGAVQRRILLNFYQGEFKPYDYEDYEQKIYIHTQVQELKKDSLVDYAWVRSEEQHILHRVWLNLDHVDAAYERAGLVSPKKDAQAVLAAVSQVQQDWLEAAGTSGRSSDLAWIGKLLGETQQILSERQRLAAPMPLSREQALLLLEAVRQLIRLLASGQTELAERVFSLQTYGDSKIFEQQVRTRMASLIRRYLIPDLLGNASDRPEDLDVSDDELLGLVGLVRAPEIFEFSGPLLLRRAGRQLDFSFFPACATLSSIELDGLQIELPPVIRRILFVENRTNFHWLVQRRSQNEDWHDTLLIYHGGFFSPARGRFFQQIREAVERAGQPAANAEQTADAGRQSAVSVFHWGDIDLGGFFIFNRLRQTFFTQLQPWHMDRSDLLSSLGQAQPISRAYAERLRLLLTDERFAVFHPVIELALEKGVRLEQEALLGQL